MNRTIKFRKSDETRRIGKFQVDPGQVTDQLFEVSNSHDGYLDRLVKYIPGEVLALYTTLDCVIRSSATSPTDAIDWAPFFVCLVGNYLFLKRVALVDNWFQIHISTLAFCVWVLSFGGPFQNLDWYTPLYGAILLPIFTFFIPIIEKT